MSHLHLARDRERPRLAADRPGGADLYLSGDILQAAAREAPREGSSPAAPSPWSTGTSRPPRPCCRRDLAPPDVAVLEQAIAERVGASRVVFLDSKRIAEAVFANHLLANVVLLGAAFQAGALPMSLRTSTRPCARWARRPTTATRSSGAAGRRTTPPRSRRAWPRAAATTAAQHLRSVARGPGHGGRPGQRSGPCRPSSRDLLTRRAAQVIDYQDARAGRPLPRPGRAGRRPATTPTTTGR